MRRWVGKWNILASAVEGGVWLGSTYCDATFLQAMVMGMICFIIMISNRMMKCLCNCKGQRQR